MKSLGNLDLQDNQLKNIVLEPVENFPSVPKLGHFIFKNQRVMVCVDISGVPVWAPCSSQINTHIHDQPVAATTWTIDHALNTSDAIVQVMDADGKNVIPDEVTQTHNQAVITFSTSQSGRAVLMMGSEEGQSRSSYAFEQSFTDSATWVVSHALGYEPIIRVFIGKQEVQPLSITHDSVNQATVTFSTAQSGTVRCI